jgi:hypothetical protein
MYPFKMYSIDVLKNRFFPLWNPLSFCGSPLFANFQSNILYPLSFFYFIFPFHLSWSFLIILQPLLAAVFTYFFLRNLGIDKLSSFLGGIIYAFSGFFIIWLEYNIHGHVAVFIPLLFLLVDKFLEKKIWGPFFSLILAIQIFAGYPQVTFYSLLFVIFYFFYRLFEKKEDKKNIFKNGVIFALFLVLGFLLAAIQLLPGFELLRLSQRLFEGIPGGESLSFLPWPHLITLFAPDFFGNPATGNFWFMGDYTNTVGYVGIASLILAFLGLIWGEKTEKWFFFFLIIIVFLYVLPTPFASLARKINFFALGAASSTRALVITNFALAVLAAFGFELLWRGEEIKKKISRVPFYCLVVLFGVGFGVFLSKKIFIHYGKFFNDYPEVNQTINSWVENLEVSLRNLVIPFGVSFCLLVIFLMIGKIKKIKKLFLIFLLFILIAEIFRFGWKYIPFTKKELLFPKTPVIEFLINQKKPFRILGGDVIPMNMWAAFGLESPAGYDAVYPLRYAQFLNVVNGGKVGDSVSRYGDIKRFDSPLIDLTNTKYILALKRDKFRHIDPGGKRASDFQLPKLKLVFEDKTVEVLENIQVLPRAFLVYDYQVESREDKIFEMLLDSKFDLKKKIVLEEQVSGTLREGNVNEVSYLEEINGNSKVLVNHDGDGLLFVSDSYYPGWKAYLDGKETKIYRANYTFRAVFVPKGKHTVDFIYKPKSFRIGMVISLAILVLLPGVFIYGAKKFN